MFDSGDAAKKLDIDDGVALLARIIVLDAASGIHITLGEFQDGKTLKPCIQVSGVGPDEAKKILKQIEAVQELMIPEYVNVLKAVRRLPPRSKTAPLTPE